MSVFALDPIRELTLAEAAAPAEALPVPRLEHYPPANPVRNARAVIVCPGGGYRMRADHEAEPIARRFAHNGFQTFVLHYRVCPERHPTPLKDAATAIAFVRKNAVRFGIDPAKIAILGFSAGGHLAASASVLYKEAEALLEPALQGTSARPDAQVLCYPVINGHTASFTHLYGENAGEAEFARFCLDRHVTPQTPPAFLWHTVEDMVVDIDNAYDYARALRANGVRYELHAFPRGPHGLGLATDEALERRSVPPGAFAEVRVWPELATTFLNAI